MTRTRLGWLAWLGWRFAGEGPWHRIRWTALMVGSMVLTGGFAAAALGLHYDQLREHQTEALHPVIVTARASAEARASASLLYSYDGFASLGEYQVLVISIWPLRPDAPLPPGVASWPQPGEAVLSPATLTSLGPGPADLFGHVAGTIAASGLESPGERRVYIRPTRAAFDAHVMTPATGFGGGTEDGAYSGLPTLNAVNPRYLLAMLAATLVVPGLLALVLGAGLDGESRTRRSRQLEGLGASGRQLAVLDLSEAWVPIAAGTAVTALGTAVFCSLDLAIPWLDAHFRSADSRSAWPDLAVAITTSFVVASATVLAVRQTRRRWRGPQDSRVIQQNLPVRLATVCVISGLLTIWVPAQSNSAVTRTLGFVFGSLVFALTVSSLLAVILSFVGKLIAAYGHRSGSSAAILGGRRLELFPTRASRVMLGICGAILVLGQLQLWTGQLSQQYRDAVDLRARVGARLVQAGNVPYVPQLVDYTRQLTGAVPVWTWIESGDPRNQKTVVSGTCEAMQALGQTCHDPAPTTHPTNPVLASMAPLSELDFRVVETTNLKQLAHHGASLNLIATGDSELDVDALQRRAYREVPGGLQLVSAGQSSLDQGRLIKNRSNWTVVWGVLGLLGIVITTGLALVGDVLAGSREVAPISGVTDQRRWLYGLTLWRLALPLAIAGALSSGAYLLLATGVKQGAETYMTPSPWLALTATAITVIAGLLLAVWCAAEMQRYGRTWRPGAE